MCLHKGRGTGQTGLVTYADADYTEEEDSKSTIGILIKYSDCPVYWQSKIQTFTATSTAEAEINSVALGLVEVL